MRRRQTDKRRRPEPEFRTSERGLTLIEILVAVAIIALLVALASTVLGNKIHKARMARCHAELRGIQTTLYDFNVTHGRFPDEEALWKEAWNGRKPGSYYFFVDDDQNSGHGNDLDFFDEHNTGSNPKGGSDVDFVVFCQHDHSVLAKYVYLVDEGPPTLVEDDNDPGWTQLLEGRKRPKEKPGK
jgi:prepilin-type N-terminal cleavage/methylation domain-containing protein